MKIKGLILAGLISLSITQAHAADSCNNINMDELDKKMGEFSNKLVSEGLAFNIEEARKRFKTSERFNEKDRQCVKELSQKEEKSETEIRIVQKARMLSLLD